MDFSSPLASEGGTSWSPCGQLVATCSPPRITVWASPSLAVAAVLPCQQLEAVDKILFSPDSNLLLVAGYKAGIVLLYSLAEEEWRGRVTTGAGGLAGVAWGGDSKHVLTLGDWGVLLTVWSLASRSVQYIKTPKQWTCTAKLSNRDGKYNAVVERRECRDCLNIFTGSDWQLVRHSVLETEDCAGALWAPHRDCIALWDSPLYYRLLVVTLDGRVELDFCAYQHQLGVKAVCWAPSGALLAVASHDNKVRIFCSQFWTQVHQLDHGPSLHEGDPVSCRALIYHEEEAPVEGVDARLALELGGSVLQQTKYAALEERPIFLDFSKPDPKKGGQVKVGVGMLEWSSCGRYMATRCDNLPCVLWLWDLERVRLAALMVQKEHIKGAAWDPLLPRLAAVSGGGSLYLWTPPGAAIARVPCVLRGETGGLGEVVWSPNGTAIALTNSNETVICKIGSKGSPDGGTDEDELDLEPSREDTT